MLTVFDLPKKEKRIAEIEEKQSDPGFWNNREQAEEISRELSELKADVDFVDQNKNDLNDQVELLKLAQEEKDNATLEEIKTSIEELQKTVEGKERELKFSGQHDKHDAIINIQAGAGGVDAQDWAQMLERMYLRLAENRGWKTKMINRSTAEEAGIKVSIFQVEGRFAYGLLKSEHGVHRLVRQSPFNADALRQTSFARVEVMPRIPEKEAPVIDDKDLRIDTYRASGAGGQHVNKTDSAVRVTHLPTGLVGASQNERSQAQNKAQAMSLLQAKLQQLLEEQQASEISELKGPSLDATWGNQIRSYVLHPYQMVKDHRSNVETADTSGVLDGKLDDFIDVI